MGPAPLNPTSPSRTEKRKGSTTGTLDPISSPNRLRERPAKFWLKPPQDRDLGAPTSASLTPLSSAVGQVDEGRSCHDESAKKAGKVESLGETTSEEVDGPERDLVSAQGVVREELEFANGVSVMKKSDGGADDGNNDGADDKKGVRTSAGSEWKCGSRRSITENSTHAATDLLHGKHVVDWTAEDVLTWIRSLPRGLAAFAEAEAFANGHVDGKKLATLTLSDIKRKEYRHAKFKAKVRVKQSSSQHVVKMVLAPRWCMVLRRAERCHLEDTAYRILVLHTVALRFPAPHRPRWTKIGASPDRLRHVTEHLLNGCSRERWIADPRPPCPF